MKRYFKRALLLSAAALVGVQSVATTASADDHTLYREPTVSKDHIVFSYAGDLWRVDREGGEAERLTTGVGTESQPYFSPDGQKVVFTGEYDGNVDVYTIDINGGTPERLTYHPGADRAAGWTKDGSEVLFSSQRESYANFLRLFTIKPGDSSPTRVPLPSAERGQFSPDGTHIAYEPLNQWQPRWKRYKGGQQDKIWIAKLEDSSITKVPHENSSDMYPMWIGDKVYFISDRNSDLGVFRLFSYDPDTNEVEELMENDGRDIKSASAGPNNTIVYEQFGTIHLYDVRRKRSKKVDISLNADVTSMRPHYKKVGERIAASGISPTGKRAVFEARGEIFTVPAKKGDVRNITQTPGVMERSPAWSPDGQNLAYFSEASGEYAIHIIDQKGHGEAREIKLPPQFYFNPVWSPDSKKIAFSDRGLTLWYVDVTEENPEPVKVDKNPINFGGAQDPSWSPNSDYIAYTKNLPNLLRAAFIHSLETGESKQVTDGMSDVQHPVFDKNGKYLYFTASTNIGESISWADMSGMGRRSTRSIYAAVLSNEDESPLSLESDDEAEKKPEAKEESKKEPKTEAAEAAADGAEQEAAEEKKESKKTTRIDFDGLERRVIAMPAPNTAYIGLLPGGEGELFAVERPAQGRGFTVHKFDSKSRKFTDVAKGIDGLDISADGKMALVRRGNRFSISAIKGMAKPSPINTGAMEARVVPEAEWNQMFYEIWRGERDFFYAENMHGLDLEWAKETYAPYVKSVKHRSDLTYLFTEMLNQLTIGHMFIRGGDQEQADRVPVGLLGADYTVTDGRYQFAKIYNGESWNPGLTAPLTQPGLNITEGQFILEVNGRSLTADQNIFEAFEATASKQTRITVADSAEGENSRTLTVVPVANERNLRNIDWVEGNRRKTYELSDGKLAYIYIPNTGGPGFTSFNRYFYSQTDKQGAVLDERFNGGGSLADYVTQVMNKSHLANIYFRYGDMTVSVPGGAIFGPKAMIINEMAGSGGDAMPWFFRKDGAGKLVGKRTWGGLVAAQRLPQLMDGGMVTAPDAAIFGMDGDWEMENQGMAPDIEVEFDPAEWRKGRDPQLEATVAHLLEELAKNPPKKPVVPPLPDYWKKR